MEIAGNQKEIEPGVEIKERTQVGLPAFVVVAKLKREDAGREKEDER
jgi:hypothetical protein